MTDKPATQEFIDSAQDILITLLRLLQFEDAALDTSFQDDQVFFQIVTKDASLIIGRTAQTLDALQFTLNRLMSRKFADAPYCVVDAEHYRERRREKLLEDATVAVERVRQTGRPWRMPLLNSIERRIIHQELKNIPDITTHSEDEEPDGRKRVVISLVPPAPRPETDAEPPPASAE
ncbi:MAG: hypothetical protein LBN38_00250 [Verrucomicrobiota bacterium]|nr:hypothetical protein [Verrucomicrobiota bacterium]